MLQDFKELEPEYIHQFIRNFNYIRFLFDAPVPHTCNF